MIDPLKLAEEIVREGACVEGESLYHTAEEWRVIVAALRGTDGDEASRPEAPTMEMMLAWVNAGVRPEFRSVPGSLSAFDIDQITMRYKAMMAAAPQSAPQGELSEEQRIAWQKDVDELAAARREADRYRLERDEARTALDARGYVSSAEDTKRLDWLEQHSGTVYRGSMGATHWVVVDERASTRKGCLGKTLREAVDDARGHIRGR